MTKPLKHDKQNNNIWIKLSSRMLYFQGIYILFFFCHIFPVYSSHESETAATLNSPIFHAYDLRTCDCNYEQSASQWGFPSGHLSDGEEIPWAGQLSITGPTHGKTNNLKHMTISGAPVT